MAQQPAGNGLSFTIVPFGDINKLPACANACGPLWDANGACVPPVVPTANTDVYQSCFCADSRVAPLATGGGANVCPNACPGNPQGLSSIANWFTSLCGVKAPGNTPQTSATGANTATATSTPGSSGTSNFSGSNGGKGGDWLSNHWQWVVMLVILVVGIAGIWIGACIWRRRYLRKKDQQTSLGQKHSGSATNPSWGPTITGTETATPMAYNAGRDAEQGATEKSGKIKPKKKWTVTERT